MAIITVYDLLEVKEDASKEEIEKSYLKLVNEYKVDPNQLEETRNQNELILKKLKLAYDILSDDAKREKYDSDLAQKRAEELIKNVTVKKEEPQEEKVEVAKTEVVQNNVQEAPKDNVPEVQNVKYKKVEKQDIYEDESRPEVELSDVEMKKIKKAAEKELKDNIKKAQKAEEEYNRAYNEAYNNYLRKMGYSVKEPWTWKRVKNLIITILAIIITCTVIWLLPPTRNLLTQIYEENFIVKSLVDIVVMLFDAIVSAFK